MMTQPQFEIQIIAALVAVACAIPGVFLVLRRMALISDAIGHSILLGIVLGFFLTHDLNSPVLILFAGGIGLLTVVLVALIQRTKLVKEDTAIGLVFPALFSIGILLISMKASEIHLDLDAVLLGELAFAPFDRLLLNGKDYGPKAMWIMGTILMFIIVLLLLFYKELKISTFDAGLAASLGFSPVLIHYLLMAVSSVTIVGAFDAVGAILVVALMIIPAATAYLLTDKLGNMLALAIVFGLFASISGYWLSNFMDASIAGAMSTMLGLLFLLVFFFAPKKGVLANLVKNKKQAEEVQLLSLLVYLDEINSATYTQLEKHFRWRGEGLRKCIALGVKDALIVADENGYSLSEKGKIKSQTAMHWVFN